MSRKWRKIENLIDESLKGITPKYVSKSTIMVINQKCIRNNKIDYSLAQYTDDSKKINEKKFIRAGDILFNSTGQGTAGRVAFVDKVPSNKQIVVDSHILIVRLKNYYEAQCLSYSFFSYEKNIQAFMDGSTGQGELDKIRVFNLLTSLTSDKKEQQKIAKVLSTLDKKIELNNQINQNLEAMAKTLYDYWFVQFDFPDANGKPYKSSGGKMVYSEELKREIPEGWEVKELGEVIEIHDSKRIPLSRQEREIRMGIYPYYGATSIMGYVDDYIFDGEYILLAEDGSVMDDKGFPIIQHVKGKIWVNNHAHVLTPKDENYFEYLFYSLKMISVVKIMTGSIQKKINQENLQSVPILLPNSLLLKKFANVVNPIRNKLISNIEETQKLTQLRDWLLPMLMNGQVSVGTPRPTGLF